MIPGLKINYVKNESNENFQLKQGWFRKIGT